MVSLMYAQVKVTPTEKIYPPVMGYISPDLAGFQPTNITQIPLQPSSTRLWLKPYSPINKLKPVTDLGLHSKKNVAPCDITRWMLHTIYGQLHPGKHYTSNICTLIRV